ncbi:hypothetical protein B0H63DRAFT_522547 [Podospora didyma]|uniref:AA1-like domain-containing protein n=1 Tax=Podospora didyma TaxID=330526 RepID=A0AAE0NPB8_9PEZI|nr:hypothetical protein B0H63DRAFT_522547 [Podospora didyma]
MRTATPLALAPLLFSGGSLALALDGNNFAHYNSRAVVDNCTESSSPSSSPYWKIDDFVLKVYDWDNGGSMGTFGFKAYYSATNSTVECLVQDVDLAKLGGNVGGKWSKCSTAGAEFQFDFSAISLTMKETWTCSGSPGTIFNANATGRLMIHGCLDSDTDKGVESDCHLMEMEMPANVTSSTLKR